MKNTIQKIFITLAGLVVSFAACILGMYMVFLHVQSDHDDPHGGQHVQAAEGRRAGRRKEAKGFQKSFQEGAEGDRSVQKGCGFRRFFLKGKG